MLSSYPLNTDSHMKCSVSTYTLLFANNGTNQPDKLAIIIFSKFKHIDILLNLTYISFFNPSADLDDRFKT